MSEIQAIYFDSRLGWNGKEAKKWLTDNGHDPIKRQRKEGHMLRYRLTEPDKYLRFTTKKLPDGIYLVIGWYS